MILEQVGDMDIMVPICACTTQRTFELLTPAELAELDRVARARGDAKALASMQRIGPELAKCVQQ